MTKKRYIKLMRALFTKKYLKDISDKKTTFINGCFQNFEEQILIMRPLLGKTYQEAWEHEGVQSLRKDLGMI